MAGLIFLSFMLAWPPGPRPSDGAWAPYWYAAVEASKGFEAPPSDAVEVPARYHGLLRAAEDCYRELKR